MFSWAVEEYIKSRIHTQFIKILDSLKRVCVNLSYISKSKAEKKRKYEDRNNINVFGFVALLLPPCCLFISNQARIDKCTAQENDESVRNVRIEWSVSKKFSDRTKPLYNPKRMSWFRRRWKYKTSLYWTIRDHMSLKLMLGR